MLRDLVSGDRVEVLNLGSANAGPGDAILGRVVPITDEPGLMFASHPMWIDDRTAHTVVEAVRGGEPLGWLGGLADAMVDGGLVEGFHAVPPHVAAALATPGAFAAALKECTGSDTADGWLVLAGVVPDHLSEPCRRLAAEAGPGLDA